MALPPTIPTSFVPHSAGASIQRTRPELTNVFALLSYVVLVIVFVLALGVFLYGRILLSEKVKKDQLLAKAEASIDSTTVEGFVRLRDRLTISQSLLDKHIAFSTFFSELTTLLPVPTRFSTLAITLDPSGVAKVNGSGVAKSFNALAAVSTAFASDDRIQDAIFSKISINKNNTVSFNVSATLKPEIVAFLPSATPLQSTEQATSSPTL